MWQISTLNAWDAQPGTPHPAPATAVVVAVSSPTLAPATAVAVAAAAPAAPESFADQLRGLAEMKSQGLLTDGEFAAAKSKLFKAMP